MRKATRYALIGLTSLSLTAFTLSQVAYGEFEADITETVTSNLDGFIKTEQYFDSGSGASDNPYVITRPAHLYYLSRLTRLGLISDNSYFQVGKDLDSSGTYKVYSYDDSGAIVANTYSTTLNMKGFSLPISPIGTETTPFFSTIDGKSISISNLTIQGNGEQDVGVFGYVASTSSISNLSFSGLNIESYGENTSSALYNLTAPSNASSIYYGASDFTAISSSNKIAIASSSKLGFTTSNSATVTTASGDYTVTYSLKSGLNGIFNTDWSINSSIFSDDASSADTNNQYINPGEATAFPIYLTESYTDSSRNYVSKVIKTYDVSIANDSSLGHIISDVSLRENEHGYNIGYLVGHLDGSMNNVFVNDNASTKSKIETNTTKTSYEANKHNSVYGLIGLTSSNYKSNSFGGDDSGLVTDQILDPRYTAIGNIQDPFSLTTDSGKPSSTSGTYGRFSDTSGSSYTDYYNTSTSQYEFPSGSITWGDSSYNYNGFNLAYDHTVKNAAYKFSDFLNRNTPERAIKFHSTGAGIIICLFANASADTSEYMLMRLGNEDGTAFNQNVQIANIDNWSSNYVISYSGTTVGYLGRNILPSDSDTNPASIANNNTKRTLEFCYFVIPSAGYYFFGGGGGGKVELAYLRFIFFSDNGNAGGYTSSTISQDTISNVDFVHTYNGVTYYSGLRLAFRESDLACLTFYVYFDESSLKYILIMNSSSSTAETITVSKTDGVTGVTYPNIVVYANNNTSTIITTLSSVSSVSISLTSSSASLT